MCDICINEVGLVTFSEKAIIITRNAVTPHGYFWKIHIYTYIHICLYNFSLQVRQRLSDISQRGFCFKYTCSAKSFYYGDNDVHFLQVAPFDCRMLPALKKRKYFFGTKRSKKLWYLTRTYWRNSLQIALANCIMQTQGYFWYFYNNVQTEKNLRSNIGLIKLLLCFRFDLWRKAHVAAI